MGILTNKDALQFRKWFNEMCRLNGQSVLYQYIIDEHWTIHSEIKAKFSDPLRLDIIFNENPSIDTLRNINWLSELNSQRPIIAVLPFDTPHLRTYNRITIEPVAVLNNKPRVFEITGLNTSLEYPDCWDCNLVPVFDSIQNPNRYEVTTNNYIDSDTPGTTAISGDGPQDTIPKSLTSNTFTFINED